MNARRPTPLFVVRSIPSWVVCSIPALWAIGGTLNVMTLGGRALAVGILVYDATVEIENVHRNMAGRKPLRRAIPDGAGQPVNGRRSWSRPQSAGQSVKLHREFASLC